MEQFSHTLASFYKLAVHTLSWSNSLTLSHLSTSSQFTRSHGAILSHSRIFLQARSSHALMEQFSHTLAFFYKLAVHTLSWSNSLTLSHFSTSSQFTRSHAAILSHSRIFLQARSSHALMEQFSHTLASFYKLAVHSFQLQFWVQTHFTQALPEPQLLYRRNVPGFTSMKRPEGHPGFCGLHKLPVKFAHWSEQQLFC